MKRGWVGPPEPDRAPPGVPNALSDSRMRVSWSAATNPTCLSLDAYQRRPERPPRTRPLRAQPIGAAFEVDEAKDTRNSPL